MKTCKNTMLLTMILALGAGAFYAAPVEGQVACFPSCEERDGRFLVLTGGKALATLEDQPLNVGFAAEPGFETMTVSIFDGDMKLNPLHWDINGFGVTATYTLLVDALGDGSILVPVPGFQFSSTEMPDNDWFEFTVSESEVAAYQSPSGNYFFKLNIVLNNPSDFDAQNAFKVKVDSIVYLGLVDQPFSFIATYVSRPGSPLLPAGAESDQEIVYPNYPELLGTTYDGTFRFNLNVTAPTDELVIWDGDLDRGKWDGTDQDTDDADTPNEIVPFVTPPFFAPSAVPEGVAVGNKPGLTSSPNDDFNPAAAGGNGKYNLRAPSVRYDVVFPDGRVFPNENPSGNREYERFRISIDPADCPSAADHCVDEIPVGIYEVRINGMDMNNLNAWFYQGTVCGTTPAGQSLCPPGALLAGDRVWLDLDSDGVGGDAGNTDGEPGLAGVLVNLYDVDANKLGSAVTNSDGFYGFSVNPGTFTVEVDPENFAAAAPGGAVGNRVWLDVNGNGFQDSGEPGIPSVEVRLFEAGADGSPGGGDDVLLGSVSTDENGEYWFTDLPPGDYYTAVVDATLPGGLVLSGGDDPSDVRTISSDQIWADLDFGYTAAAGTAVIGDRVWLDVDDDGVQDAGEPGIGFVTVNLLDGGGDGLGGAADTLVASKTTIGGFYLFTDVTPGGDYWVAVTDAFMALDGLTATTPIVDGPISVGAGDAYLEADFGYDTDDVYSLSDAVWFDTDRDGQFDAGEAGLAGVTVTLLDERGGVVASTSTAADGSFSFSSLLPGEYTMVITDQGRVLDTLLPTTAPAVAGEFRVEIVDMAIANESFGYNRGGQLADLFATTPSPRQTNVLVDANVLTYDFGYASGSCDIGRPFAVAFEYTGHSCDDPNASRNDQGGRPGTKGDYYCNGSLFLDEPVQLFVMKKSERFRVTPSQEILEIGDRVTISSTTEKQMFPATRIELRQGGQVLQEIGVHTSCSQPFNVGDQFGSLVVRAFQN
ncbi:MAG: carboxypeptidase regulatory-like domain-containing protein [Acidobacteriota bacterium]|nr:carboxypeptidase regulatory-like domain-containing protein [Acidobacteriota bacterium]